MLILSHARRDPGLCPSKVPAARALWCYLYDILEKAKWQGQDPYQATRGCRAMWRTRWTFWGEGRVGSCQERELYLGTSAKIHRTLHPLGVNFAE